MRDFYEWLMEQNQRRDNVGDLAREVQGDLDASPGTNNPVDWYNYLDDKDDSDYLQKALVHAWFIYDPTRNFTLEEML